ncbi:hypothetical protein C6A77_19390 [Pseudomonas sp. AFG_SD02_1510_Pfu_092]|uniref:hypothetical protein n=1 Tax=Pseudomonas sp. AFG_SD02_1510_Pfu_092 TaxID=2259497 RepID=UPI000DEF0117|nr:hypothetical protein [Pseudomonas sp. AFG_SD02_1510_Pfu_092]RCL23004.1 hypothetical protein C6A77_19390 [Pseudomonas sp. AFG_SD02_1510_Pfu_092]
MSSLPVPQHSPDAEHRFFVFDAMDGDHYYFKSAAERDQYAEYMIGNYMDDGWDESVEQVMAGELTHLARQTNRVERPPAEELDAEGCDREGRHWRQGWAYYCDYELLPLVAPVEAARPDAGEAVTRQLASAATQRYALHCYTEALAQQTRAVIAGGIDVNTARRLRGAWETALLQRLQAPLASLEKVAPAGEVPA